MFLTHLSLADFRSYPSADVPLAPGVTVFTGANGQGKTNLVEAVELLATLGSHRVANEAPLIRAGAERAVVRARVQAGVEDARQLLLELELIPGKSNRASLNRSPLKRPRELLGALKVVVFAPDDLAIVKGDPSGRRRYLDDLITQRWPRLAGVRADYDRVLRQRSTLLKSLSGRGGRVATDAATTLEIWDESVARFGAEIVEARLATVADLAPLLEQTYARIAPGLPEGNRHLVAVTYTSSSLEGIEFDPLPGRDELHQALLARMAQRRHEEIARGVCLVGPHRDDLVLRIGDLPARGYASHGESWSLALALRLAGLEVLREDAEPVLILDDVFAELDETRRTRLAGMVADSEQVLITAAVAADVPAALSGTRFLVTPGQVDPA